MSDIVGSSHSLACVFTSAAGPQPRYAGVVHRVGVDVGFTQESALGWAVFAPTYRIGPGNLGGRYGAVTADGGGWVPMRWWKARTILSRFNR
jgi:hypothetical protein